MVGDLADDDADEQSFGGLSDDSGYERDEEAREQRAIELAQHIEDGAAMDAAGDATSDHTVRNSTDSDASLDSESHT